MLRDATEPESRGGRTRHDRELFCSKCRTVVVDEGGEKVQQDNDATSKVTETSLLPFRQVAKLQSWRSVRSMELDEQLLLHVTRTPGSSARQNGTLENSQAFLGNLKSALEAGVQQKWQQTAHFHVHRGCLGHPSP